VLSRGPSHVAPTRRRVAALEEGRRTRPVPGWTTCMMRRRGLMFIVMAVCWIVLLALVVTSVFQTTKKQHQGKDRQSTQTW
jgi:uncharacterized membrane protein